MMRRSHRQKNFRIEVFSFSRYKFLKIQGNGVISILLISLPKVIYAELFLVKDTPIFFQAYFRITLYKKVHVIIVIYGTSVLCWP
jgi:hypothetical protein